MNTNDRTGDFTRQYIDGFCLNYIEERVKSRQLRLSAFFTLSL